MLLNVPSLEQQQQQPIRGELIGLNFDRNWEGTMSDIMYDPEMCRNISVDIRYILFIVDKFAGAVPHDAVSSYQLEAFLVRCLNRPKAAIARGTCSASITIYTSSLTSRWSSPDGTMGLPSRMMPMIDNRTSGPFGFQAHNPSVL